MDSATPSPVGGGSGLDQGRAPRSVSDCSAPTAVDAVSPSRPWGRGLERRADGPEWLRGGDELSGQTPVARPGRPARPAPRPRAPTQTPNPRGPRGAEREFPRPRARLVPPTPTPSIERATAVQCCKEFPLRSRGEGNPAACWAGGPGHCSAASLGPRRLALRSPPRRPAQCQGTAVPVAPSKRASGLSSIPGLPPPRRDPATSPARSDVGVPW